MTTAPPALRRLPRPVRRFIETEASGGIVLLVAGVVALAWANSPWSAGYESLWSTELHVSVFAEDLRHWVNDGLMAVFFFVVGLEIKRELVAGELRDPRTAALPAIAAVGGMVVPAALYLALNAGRPGVDGWGIPMATDIAFAVGVVALVSSRVPPAVKLFLLTLAVVDDIGSIVVIAVFYAGGIDRGALAVAAAAVLVLVALRALRVDRLSAYLAVGVVLWVATYQSGVHPTIAGIVLALLMPPAEQLESRLHPLTSFVVVPLFALANAGVALDGDAFDPAGAVPVALGVAVGLVAGKVIGIAGASWVAVRLGAGRLPSGLTARHVLGAAAVAGIGFTVSIFVSGLAFPDAPELEAPAKIGILGASVVAALLGTAVLATSPGSLSDEKGSSPPPDGRHTGR